MYIHLTVCKLMTDVTVIVLHEYLKPFNCVQTND